MAWTTEVIEQPDRWTMFSFFTGVGADGNIQETANPYGKQYKFNELRLHFSIPFPSVQDLTIRISSIIGSEHNLTLLSQAMLSIQDVLLQFEEPIHLLSDDEVIISLAMVSGAAIGGLNVQGWGVMG
jgi:hypothetical protein